MPVSTTPSEATRTHEDLVTLGDIRRAAAGLSGITVRTPLIPFGRPVAGDPRGHPRSWIKPESLQPIGAFKLRGAWTAVSSLGPAERSRGVVAHSSGNHAQGVARAARLLGVPAVIVMPEDAPAVKVAGVRTDGAEIVFVGTSSDERVAMAERLVAERGLVLIPAYDDPRIIAGQGTCGLEIVDQVAELGNEAEPLTVLVPIGGGGFAAGVATAVKGLRPDAWVFGVEPELAADAAESLRTGAIVRWGPELVGRTAADGMRTNAVGAIPFRHLQAYLDGVVTVSETDIARAMVRGAREARLVIEPSGATTVAALLFDPGIADAPGHVVAIVSGGNVDPARYEQLIAEGIAAGG
ncbi:MAG: threonine/serine dehydratase [Candidatus Limnocylindrales bacterium]